MPYIYKVQVVRMLLKYLVCLILPIPKIWYYGLWGFQARGTKLERYLPKNQPTQRKLLNFENWVNGELSKIELILVSKVI